MVVGMRAVTMHRMIPIFHDLSHGTSHTTGIAMIAIPIVVALRSIIIIRIILIPQRLNQRRNRLGVFSSRQLFVFQQVPFFSNIRIHQNATLIAIIDIFTVTVDKIPSCLRYFTVKTVLYRVSEHRSHVSRSRNNHKTAAFDIINIKIRLAVVTIFDMEKIQPGITFLRFF